MNHRTIILILSSVTVPGLACSHHEPGDGGETGRDSDGDGPSSSTTDATPLADVTAADSGTTEGATSGGDLEPEALESATGSLSFLARIQDQYHQTVAVYEDIGSAGNHFKVLAFIPDETAPVAIDTAYTAEVDRGATSIRCELEPPDGPGGYGGVYFMNGVLVDESSSPTVNFGTIPNAGVDLSGATTLRFRAKGAVGGEQVDFFVAGVGRDAATGVAVTPFPDSASRFPALGTPPIVLGPDWETYEIDVSSLDFGYVLGGFAFVTTHFDNPEGAIFYIDDIIYELDAGSRAARLAEPRLLASFVTLPVQTDPLDDVLDDDFDTTLRNVAYTYDNALALLAFLAAGTEDGLRRARLIGDAFVYASNHDRLFDDGRLRSAYSAGDIALPDGWIVDGSVGTMSVPGFYDPGSQSYFEVEQGDVDVGDNAWAMIALLALHRRTGVVEYLDTASAIGTFIRGLRQESGSYQGFTGGIDDPEGRSQPREWASSEHNLDVFAAFSERSASDGDTTWIEDASHAEALVNAMWHGGYACYLAGTINPESRNESYELIPLDVQSWAVLALQGGDAVSLAALDCALGNHLVPKDSSGIGGFDFNTDRDGVWFEGTAQMAVAFANAGDVEHAREFREELRTAQASASYGDGEGLTASTRDGLTTGFGFGYFRRLHVGATAWNVFAQTGSNPYYIE